MKLHILPETVGYICVRPVKIVRKGSIETIDKKGRLESKLGIVESEGELNGKIVMYHYCKKKDIVFNMKNLMFVRIADILATVEIEDGQIINDILEIDTDSWHYNAGNKDCGDPEVFKL